jgi:hypothetical protein
MMHRWSAHLSKFGRGTRTNDTEMKRKKLYGAFGGVIAEGELSSVQLKKIRKILPNIT